MNDNKKTFMKKMGLSVLLLFAFLVPVIIIHEVGHLTSCTLLGFNGSSSLVGLDLDEIQLIGTVDCHDITYGHEMYVYWASGGLLAGGVFAAWLAVPYVRRNAWLAAPIFAITCNEIMTAGVETAYHDWYILSNGGGIILDTMLGVGFIFGWLFFDRSAPPQNATKPAPNIDP